MENQDNFSHAATIFPVKNLQSSIDFYTQKLEFKLTFTYGDPLSYAVLKKGGASIHLVKKSDDRIPSKAHCALYIFVYEIEKSTQSVSLIRFQLSIPPKLENIK